MNEVIIDSIRATYSVRGDKAVILCPPHPLMGGNRFDIRLEKIASELIKNNISTLRFDYQQPFRSGIGEIEDAKKVLRYLKDRHNSIAIVGYSFGSVVASNVSDYCDATVYISPIPRINSISFRFDSNVPKLFVVATKDQFLPFEESMRLYERASNPKRLLEIETDHFYFGKLDVLSRSIAEFIMQNL